MSLLSFGFEIVKDVFLRVAAVCGASEHRALPVPFLGATGAPEAAPPTSPGLPWGPRRPAWEGHGCLCRCPECPLTKSW